MLLMLRRSFHTVTPLHSRYHNPKISMTVSKRFKKHMDDMVVSDIKRQKKEEERKGPVTAPKHPILYDTNRTQVFNRKFFESIGLVMSQMQEMLGKGITITKVNVRQDFSEVRVFWVSRENQEEVSELLEVSRKKIRRGMYESSGLGQLPRIVFVRDTAYQLSVHMDTLFKKLDVGLDNPLKDNVWIEAQELKLGVEAGGVKRDEIMKRVEMSIAKSKATHRECYSEEDFQTVYRESIERNGAAHKLEVKRNIKKFLVSRRKAAQQKTIEVENEK